MSGKPALAIAASPLASEEDEESEEASDSDTSVSEGGEDEEDEESESEVSEEDEDEDEEGEEDTPEMSYEIDENGMRPLAPGEELLSEEEESDEDEEASLWAWHRSLDTDLEAVKAASMEDLQMAMDMDKERNEGKGERWREKSGKKQKSIADCVARRQYEKWAAEFAKEHPGMYSPYPGLPSRAVRPAPRSAADKARSARRKK